MSKLITYDNLTSYDQKIKALIADADALSLHTVLFDSTNKQIKFYTEENATLSDVAAYTIDIPADLDGSATIASIAGNVVTLKAGIVEADGIVSNNSGSDIVLAAVAKTGAAGDVSYTNTTSGLSASTVQSAIDEVAAQSAGGVESKTVYLQDESAGQSDYAKVYKLYQGANAPDAAVDPAALIGTINVPLDKVVQDGHVVTVEDGVDSDGDTVPSGTADGTYIKLTFQNVAQPAYINVQDLVDVYTGGTTAEATVAISATNEITVSINKINATKVVYREADPSQSITEQSVTAKINEIDAYIGSIPGTSSATDVIGYVDEQVTAAVPGTATETQTAGVDGLALSVTTSGGIVTAVSGSIASGTYDAYGTASGLIANLDATPSQSAGADGLALSLTEVDGVVTAISGSIAANTYEPYGSTTSAIANLDATETQAAGTDGLALSITEVDGVITNISGSIAAGTYLDTATYTMAQESDIAALFS